MLTLLSIISGNGLLAFLTTLLILAVIIYGLILIFGMIRSANPKIPSQIFTLIWIIVTVLAVVYLYNRFGGVIGL